MIFRMVHFGSIEPRDRGFTMIELVTVLLILGIISAVVASRMISTTTYSLESEREVIKAHLRYAQTRSLNTDTRWGIYFETANTYWLFKGNAPDTSGRSNLVRLPGEDSIITLRELTISGFPRTVVFDGLGSPGNTAVSISTSGGTITVSANTGFIS